MSTKTCVYKGVSQNEEISGQPHITPPKGIGQRHIQCLILFLSLSIGYALRAHLSISLVAMTTSIESNKRINVNQVEVNDTNNTTTDSDIDAIERKIDRNISYSIVIDKEKDSHNKNKEEKEIRSSWSVYKTYKWNKATQEMILFAFFVGYTSMMIPMGIVAQKFGGKIPILNALGANGVLSFVSPWVPIFSGWIGMCLVRLLQGMTQAAFYPSIHTILAKWTPLSERGRLSTYVYTGSQFGTVVAFQLAGLFAGSSALGWPTFFWVSGLASLAIFGLVAKLGASTPEEHTSIRSEELAFIQGDGTADVNSKKRKTPWKEIITSKTVWGLVATQSGSTLAYLLILTQIPVYMKFILGVDIKRNGVFSSLPYIAMYFMMLLFGYLSDYCVTREIMSIANVRRVANSIGMVTSGLLLVTFSFVQNTYVAVILLVMCVGSHAGVHVGFHINQIDLAPNFAGPIMALGNMIGNLCSLIAPVLVYNIVGDDLSNQRKWQLLFIIVASIMVITNLIFVIFVKGTVQPWNFYGEIIEIDPEENCKSNEINDAATKNNGTGTND